MHKFTDILYTFRYYLNFYFYSRPGINISKCVGCGKCKIACDTQAIDLFALIPTVEIPPKTGEPRSRPEVDILKCVRCYKCKDVCKKGAISIIKPILYRTFSLLGLNNRDNSPE